MKSNPLVLVSPGTEARGVEFSDNSISLSECYARVIMAAGAVPLVMIPTPSIGYIVECVKRCDGVVLSGGEDIQPRIYLDRVPPGLERRSNRHEPARDVAELLLIAETFRQEKPLFAICRGHQLVNVGFGGTLFVDIATQLPHAMNHARTDRKNDLVHEIKLARGSLMERLAGDSRLRVNSTHHQAVARPAGMFRVTAASADGVVEAVELKPAYEGLLPWFLSVQFHPERLFTDHPVFLGLFSDFVKACGAGGGIASLQAKRECCSTKRR